MRFAINPATTMPYDFETDLAAYQKAGFHHMELWIDKLDKYMQKHELAEARTLLAKHELELVGACCAVELMLKDVKTNPPRLADLKRKLELCQKLNCPTLIIVPDFPKQSDPGVYGTVEKNLKVAAGIAADYNVKLALEFIQGCKLIGTLSTAKDLVRAVNHPNLGILLDLFHFWMDRSHVEDIDDLKPSELLLVHLNETRSGPPECIAGDGDRVFPGQGRGNVAEMVKRIKATGYDGFWSLELFDKKVWEWPIDRIMNTARESLNKVEALR
jgi:2-keto-myo-inositol isomerase